MGATTNTAVGGQRLLNPDEAAERLGIARWKLYEMARRGVIASIKEGRTIRFDPADLDTFIASHRRPVVGIQE